MSAHAATGPSRGLVHRAYGRAPERLKRTAYRPIKRALFRRVPDAVWWPLQRATRFRHAPLDAAPLARIASAPLDRLADPDFLTHEILPAMGLTTWGALEPVFPRHLRSRVGRGVQAIQFPNQFGPYLAAMTQAGVTSYVEIGVDRGGTFAITVEVLRRFGLRRALAVDVFVPPILEQWSRPEVEFVQLDSRSPAFADLLRERAPIDLALIDGDHLEDGVRSDFDALRPHARMLAFHDIVQEYGWPGVGRVWGSIREEYSDGYEFTEFVADYPEIPHARMGIGLAARPRS